MIPLGIIIGAGEAVAGLFLPGTGIATAGLCRICKSAVNQAFVKPVVNEVLAPVVEEVGDALDLEGSTVGELLEDLYVNKTNYAELVELYP